MRDIVANGGGINWCWYHWFTVDEDARTVVETRADRFHRFDERQGAGNHPKANCSFEVYHAPQDTPERRAQWGDDWIDRTVKSWATNLETWNLPSDTQSVVVFRGDVTGAYVWVKP